MEETKIVRVVDEVGRGQNWKKMKMVKILPRLSTVGVVGDDAIEQCAGIHQVPVSCHIT